MKTETKNKEHPILFNGEMVHAILDGRKTQTRRVMKDQPGKFVHIDYDDDMGWHRWWDVCLGAHGGDVGQKYKPIKCPYGKPGDHLWVRETWCLLDRDHWWEPAKPRDWMTPVPQRNAVACRAESGRDAESERCRIELGYKWKPSIFMPRWASRITLEVTDVDVERVQDISRDDSIAEGISKRSRRAAFPWHVYIREDFSYLWDSINAKRGFSWESNPWVWVVSFKRIKP